MSTTSYDWRTIFTPPPSCFGNTYTIAPHGHDYLLDYQGGTVDEGSVSDLSQSDGPPLTVLRGIDFACYPRMTWIDQGTSWFATVQGVSPAICPSGYESALIQPGSTDTTLGCCPSDHIGLTSFVGQGSSLGNLCFKWNTNDFATLVNRSATMTYPIHYSLAEQIRVTYAQSDLSYWTTTAPMGSSTLSAEPQAIASRGSPTSSDTSHEATDLADGPSPNAKAKSAALQAGLGAGGSIIFIALLIFGFWYWFKRARTQKRRVPDGEDVHYSKPELSGEGNYKAQLEKDEKPTPMYELPSPDQAKYTSELDGDWRGTEAAAMVEIDLSRPQRGKEAAKMEILERTKRES